MQAESSGPNKGESPLVWSPKNKKCQLRPTEKQKDGTAFVITITNIRATDQVHGFPWETESEKEKKKDWTKRLVLWQLCRFFF